MPHIQVFPVQLGADWLMIELQGLLETRSPDSAAQTQTSLGDLDLGTFQFKDKDMVEAVIGSHLLTGKLTSVSPPFAVLKKRRVPIPTQLDDAATAEDAAQPQTRTELDIVAVIRQKIIFKIRPKPLISEENRGLATVARK